MYKVLSPNLDRRPDRWNVFTDALVAQGTPVGYIERFSSHDGRNYHTMEDAQTEALKHGWSRYLSCARGIDQFNFCWCWSWYDCIAQIAACSDGYPRLLVIDDCRPLFSYEEICQHLSVFNAEDAPFMIAQYGGPGKTSVSRVNNKALPSLPIFQYGLAGSWDIAVMYSPAGARWLLSFIDNRDYSGLPIQMFRPCSAGAAVAQLSLGEQRGMYGVTLELPLAWPKCCGWTALLPTGDDDSAVQDRCEHERPQTELRAALNYE